MNLRLLEERNTKYSKARELIITAIEKNPQVEDMKVLDLYCEIMTNEGASTILDMKEKNICPTSIARSRRKLAEWGVLKKLDNSKVAEADAFVNKK